MSDEHNRTIEFQETSMEQSHDEANSQQTRTATTFPTQSDRFQQPSVAGLNSTTRRGIISAPTHEDFDLIIDNCRRGRTAKSAATKDLLESLEQLTDLAPHTKEKTFISYLAEINSIE